MSPDTCPNCGADVPAGSRACPECGADEHTGWSDEARASGLGLPDDSFDYDDYVQREFGSRRRIRPRGIRWFWWMAAIVVLVFLVLGGFRLLQ
jgi:predicted nucleic acid-binding Zn ribbon protein